jgi:hypothetical protein
VLHFLLGLDIVRPGCVYLVVLLLYEAAEVLQGLPPRADIDMQRRLQV